MKTNSHWREQTKGVERMRPSKTSRKLRKMTSETEAKEPHLRERWLMVAKRCLSHGLLTDNASKEFFQRNMWRAVSFPELVNVINVWFQELWWESAVWRHQLSLFFSLDLDDGFQFWSNETLERGGDFSCSPVNLRPSSHSGSGSVRHCRIFASGQKEMLSERSVYFEALNTGLSVFEWLISFNLP